MPRDPGTYDLEEDITSNASHIRIFEYVSYMGPTSIVEEISHH